MISRWGISLVGTALLAGLVWFFAPLLPAFVDWLPRLALIVALLLVWGVSNALLDIRRGRRDAALARGIAASAEQTEEAQALRSRLSTALVLLKQSLRSRGYLYEQPWYAIIGPPGAGKTTALLNAGLRFPLAEQMGQGAVAGVGGTRLCDWWFTEDAVLIDTAGRYTTQDSNAAVDRAGWDAFLDLLKETRPKQPLNGLLVAFPLSDIAQAPAAERAAHAAAIRGRIKELQTRFGVRMPVYMLFTKADLTAGFTEFFDDLDRERRAQVWGTTFDLARHDDDPVAAFAGELRTLVERLNARLFNRLQAERNPDRWARIAIFPGQVASLEPVLMEFLQAAFGGTRDDPAPLLRGVYFTSGTQEGTPIDRLTGTMARALGVDQTRTQTLQPVQGRSYFLERLLKEVVFGEALLVARSPAAVRRQLVLRIAGYGVAILLVVATAAVLWQVHNAGQREIDAVAAALAGYERTARSLPLDPVADDDLARLAPLLDQARALPHGGDEPAWLPALLSQHEKLNASARAMYRHALDWALLPRLMWRLETQLRGNLNNRDFLYEATRVYLMLGNAGPLDASLVREWMKLDWQTAYPGLGFVPLREALLRHLDALLAEPLPQVQLDGELVTAARLRIATVPLAQRVYSRIRPSAAAQRLPEWRPSDALGAAGVPLFVRASGKPLTDGIPGFFTVDGFHKVLLPSLASATRSVVSESWVLGNRVAFDPNGPQMPALERDVITLYEADYAPTWDLMLADLNVVQLRSLSQAAQDLYILASPESPMRNLLASISRQLTLSVPPGGVPKAPEPEPSASNTQLRLQAVLGASQPATQAAPLLPGHEIDERYQALRDLIGHGPNAPIDLLLREVGDAQQQIAKLAATLVSTGAATSSPGGIDPLLTLKTDAARQPQPLGRWLTEIATGAIALRSGDPRLQLATIFNAPGGPNELCPAVVNGHYPFVPNATDDAPIADFARLFAPGGAFDGFVNTLLRRYVDTSGKPWRLISADAASAPVSAADLAQFQRAAAIRDAFFADGGTRPHFRLDVTPVSADAATKQVTLDLDGTTIVYTREAPRSTQVTWPSFSLQPTMRLVFDPPPAGRSGVVQESGPWALFRLLGHGRMQAQAGAADRYALTLQLGERQAVFDVRVQASANPLAPGLLQDFHCPSVRAN
ncbi:MAG TPA: type VI secretion system membrane subunit TssM [Acetobacteraceae bacterium]|nr:type VI secretion system membrane subunit TssM [Acetobacteraceae bacterium]